MMTTRNSFLLAICFLGLWLQPARAQGVFQEQRVSPSDFVIMSWGPASADPKQLQWMKDAGINVAGFAKAGDLAAYEKAGLKVFVTDPRVNGYDFDKPLDEGLVRRNIESIAKEVGSNSAVLGFMLRDEPHARAMPNLGVVSRLIQEYMPGKWPYVNLFPYRVSQDRMGTSNYTEYVNLLLKTVRQPFLSYDNYGLLNGYMYDSFFSNLEIVRRLSVDTGAPFWNCVLSNAHFNYMENTEATYSLQAYSTMAHGARGIQYFSYFTWPLGNYRLGPIDQFGNKTPSWDMLRRVNNQVHVLASTLKRLKSTGVYHYPDVPPEGRRLSESKLVKMVVLTQVIEPPVQGRFLIGEFQDDAGRPYVMLVNKDLVNSFRFRFEFQQAGQKLIHISQYSGQEEPFGREMDWIAPGAGHLFRVE